MHSRAGTATATDAVGADSFQDRRFDVAVYFALFDSVIHMSSPIARTASSSRISCQRLKQTRPLSPP